MTKLTTSVDKETVSASGSSVTAALRIQPGMQESPVTRQIALCIDTSGSMSGAKIEQVREGILWVFGYLEDEDYISIVTFDDEVEVVLPATRWGDISLDEGEAVVEDIQPGGGTDILSGLETAAETLAELPIGDDVGRRILLLSDGRDETPTGAFAEFARRVRRDGRISIPAAGIGDFYDEETIRAVGTASEGEWVHLSQAGDIENFFGRKVETLRTVVAPSPNLQIDLVQGATIGEVLLRTPQVRDVSHEQTGDTTRVYLPDLVEFETQEILLTIDTPPWTAGDTFTLADVTLNTRDEATSETIDVTCAADVRTQETVIEDESVAIKHVETMVRKAASEGDIERAQTIVKQASGGTAEIEGQETVVQDDSVTDDETVIKDESVTEQETVIESDSRAGDDTAVPDLETVVDEETLADLETVIDDETVEDLNTVIESADGDDMEAQYETTKIKDEDHR